MSCVVCFNSLPQDKKDAIYEEFITKNLILDLENAPCLYKIGKKWTVIPLGCCQEIERRFGVKLDKKKRPCHTVSFAIGDINLTEGQFALLGEVAEHFKEHETLYLKACTGYGKTRIGVCLSFSFKLKTVVLMNSTSLIECWCSEIAKVSSAKVFVVPQGFQEKDLPDGYDIYIVMVLRCRNLSEESLSSVGLLIVEEAKYLCTRTGIQQILRFRPKRILALCAEDSREDEFGRTIDILFGSERIVRDQVRPLTVIEISTPFQPVKHYQKSGMYRGRLNWVKMASEFYENVERNNFLVDLLLKYSVDYKIIAFASRTSQANYVYQELKKKEDLVSCALYAGSIDKIENARITIATNKKGSIGFDASNKVVGYDGIPFQMVVFMSSYVKKLQGVGRSRCESPVIVEIVDDCNVIKKHYKKTCSEVYKPRNAKFQKIVVVFGQQCIN